MPGTDYDVIIVGGGLSGLVSSFLLKSQGLSVLLIEKKSYPFHRVCGEYISNEVIPFLKTYDLFPYEHQPAQISRFRLTSIKGSALDFPLDLGGFGISRFTFDDYLQKRCKCVGVELLENSTVSSIKYREDEFGVKLQNGREFTSRIVIGAYGKRSRLDYEISRKYIQKRSPYIGVKYHIEFDHPGELISLHNFRGGYCGISNVENGITNLCYLGRRSYLSEYGDIDSMEKEVLHENPFLADIFSNAKFLFKKPIVINEISFATKTSVEDHILMAGDAAGMVTPLCGNGMAIAIRSAKIVSDLVVQFLNRKISRNSMEQQYTQAWNQNFRTRLWAGRNIQKLFGKLNISEVAIAMAHFSPKFRNTLMKNTHGKPFE